MKKTKLFGLLFMMVILGSCIKDKLDLNTGDITISPEWVLPLGVVDLTVSNILPSSPNLLIDPDSSLRIYYHSDSLVRFDATKFFTLPSEVGFTQSIPMGTINLRNLEVLSIVSLNNMLPNFNGPTQTALVAADGNNTIFPSISPQNAGTHSSGNISAFQNAQVISGLAQVEVTNNLLVPISTISINVVDQTNGNTYGPFNLSSSLGAGSSALTGTINISNRPLSSNFQFQILSFGTPGSAPNSVMVNLNDDIEMKLIVSNMVSSSGQAAVAQQTLVSANSEAILSMGNGEELKFMELNGGIFNYSFDSDYPFPVQVTITFPESSVNGGAAFSVSQMVMPGQSPNWSQMMAGADFDLGQGFTQAFNAIPVSINISTAGTTTAVAFAQNNVMAIDFVMEDMSYGYASGYFGNRLLGLDGNSIEIDIPILSKLSGGLLLENPVIRLMTQNELGIPFDVAFDLIATNTYSGNTQPLDMQPYIIPFPNLSQVGQNILGESMYDKTNSSIVPFLGVLPNQISFVGDIVINPAGNTGAYDNFSESVGEIVIGVEAEIPIAFRLQDLSFIDTMYVDLPFENPEELEYAKLYINNLNGFGLSAEFEIHFYDGNDVLLDVLEVGFLDAAITDQNGKVIEPTLTKNIIELDQAFIENVQNTEKVVLRATLNSPNGGNTPIKLYDYNYLRTYLGVEAKVNLTLGGN